MPDEPLGLLLVRTGQMVAARVDAIGRKRRHGELLRMLKRTGSTSQQQLIEDLQVDPSVLVGLLNELERDGLVHRVRDPTDRRRHIVQISAQGAAKLAEVEKLLSAVEREVFAALDDDDRHQLRRILTSVQSTQSVPVAEPAPAPTTPPSTPPAHTHSPAD